MNQSTKHELRAVKGLDMPPTALNFQVKGELVVYEVPWLEHVVNDRGEDFLLKFSDTDRKIDRWMLYRVTPSGLLDFFNRKVNLRDLINNNPDGYVLYLDYEIQGGSQPVRVLKTKTKDIPNDCLPFENSFYDKNDFMYYEYCEQLRQQLEARLTPKRPYKIQPETSHSVLNEPPTE